MSILVPKIYSILIQIQFKKKLVNTRRIFSFIELDRRPSLGILILNVSLKIMRILYSYRVSSRTRTYEYVDL